MTDLLGETVAAHGGLTRWHEITNINTHLASTGAVWEVKGQTGLFTSVDVDIAPRNQHVAATPFVHAGWRGVFERDRVWIENESGAIEEERTQPRSTFDGHELFTPWDHLHAIYFGGTAQQVLYIDDAGLIRRHDYTAEVTAGAPGRTICTATRTLTASSFPPTARYSPARTTTSRPPSLC
jgi:hypothetical protein